MPEPKRCKRFLLTEEGFHEVDDTATVRDHSNLLILTLNRVNGSPAYTGLGIAVHEDTQYRNGHVHGARHYHGTFVQPVNQDASDFKNVTPQPDPGYTVRCLVIDAIKMFVIARYDINKLRPMSAQLPLEPVRMHVTLDMETLLRHHFRVEKMEGMGTAAEPLRPAMLLGLSVVWDANDFRLE